MGISRSIRGGTETPPFGLLANNKNVPPWWEVGEEVGCPAGMVVNHCGERVQEWGVT